MMFRFPVSIPALLLALLFCFACGEERQELFPSSPITIVVPWAAGGGTDSIARSIANEATKIFDVQVNVENRVGGSGTMGHSYGANTAKPDGHIMTLITFELCSYKPLGRAPIDDTNFKAVMQLNEDPCAITVHAESPWKTLQEFLDYAKQNPGRVTIGNSGPGAVWHLGALKLEKTAGVQFAHVPHDGAKPAVVQLIGKHIDAVSVSPAEVLQDVQVGTLRCLAVMSEERDPMMPDVPTFKEMGVDLLHGTWRGLAVPKTTPDEIVNTLEEGFKKAYDTEAFQKTAKDSSLGLKYRNSEEFSQFLRNESESIAELVKGLEI